MQPDRCFSEDRAKRTEALADEIDRGGADGFKKLTCALRLRRSREVEIGEPRAPKQRVADNPANKI